MTSTQLSNRELEVATLAILGRTDAEIARVLTLSCRTVEAHMRKILAKTGCRNRTELAARETMPEVLKQLEQLEQLEQLPANGAPVRITVDLSPMLYHKLADYTIKRGRELGITRLAQAEVIRAMIGALGNDFVDGALTAIIMNSAAVAIGRRVAPIRDQPIMRTAS